MRGFFQNVDINNILYQWGFCISKHLTCTLGHQSLQIMNEDDIKLIVCLQFVTMCKSSWTNGRSEIQRKTGANINMRSDPDDKKTRFRSISIYFIEPHLFHNVCQLFQLPTRQVTVNPSLFQLTICLENNQKVGGHH